MNDNMKEHFDKIIILPQNHWSLDCDKGCIKYKNMKINIIYNIDLLEWIGF